MKSPTNKSRAPVHSFFSRFKQLLFNRKNLIFVIAAIAAYNLIIGFSTSRINTKVELEYNYICGKSVCSILKCTFDNISNQSLSKHDFEDSLIISEANGYQITGIYNKTSLAFENCKNNSGAYVKPFTLNKHCEKSIFVQVIHPIGATPQIKFNDCIHNFEFISAEDRESNSCPKCFVLFCKDQYCPGILNKTINYERAQIVDGCFVRSSHFFLLIRKLTLISTSH